MRRLNQSQVSTSQIEGDSEIEEVRELRILQESIQHENSLSRLNHNQSQFSASQIRLDEREREIVEVTEIRNLQQTV